MNRKLLSTLLSVTLGATSFFSAADIIVKAQPNSKYHQGTPVVNNENNHVHITRTITNDSNEYEMISYYADLIMPNNDKRRLESYEATMSPQETILPWKSFITISDDMPNGNYRLVYYSVERMSGKVTEASFNFVKSVENPFSINAGPIWNNADAQKKCPAATKHYGGWNGQWTTTIPGRMSVCGTVDGNDEKDQFALRAGPIWNHTDAQKKCPEVTKHYGGWTGHWYTTDWGKMSVCIAADQVSGK